MNNNFVLGVDVGGSHVSSAIVRIEDFELMTQPVVSPIDSSANAMSILRSLRDNIVETYKQKEINIKGIALAFPGPFDYFHGVSKIINVGKFDMLFGVNIRESLRALLYPHIKQTEILFINDASAFSLGECLNGVACSANKVVCITLGTGIGSSFVENKILLEHGRGVPTNGWVYNLYFDGSIADDAFSTRWIINRYYELSGRKVTGAKNVADIYNTDEYARMVYQEYGTRLGTFLGPILQSYDADMLVLGGNITKAYSLFGSYLQSSIKQYIDVDIQISISNDTSAIIGAVSTFI